MAKDFLRTSSESCCRDGIVCSFSFLPLHLRVSESRHVTWLANALGVAQKSSRPIARTYCDISFACKKSDSACVGAGASGLVKASCGKPAGCVATANNSRSFLFRDVTIALRHVSTAKITSLASEKIARSHGAQLTCSHCAWSEVALTGR